MLEQDSFCHTAIAIEKNPSTPCLLRYVIHLLLPAIREVRVRVGFVCGPKGQTPPVSNTSAGSCAMLTKNISATGRIDTDSQRHWTKVSLHRYTILHPQWCWDNASHLDRYAWMDGPCRQSKITAQRPTTNWTYVEYRAQYR